MRLHDGFEFKIKPCNLELPTQQELDQEADLLREQLEFKEFVRSNPFPSPEDCICRLQETDAITLPEWFGSRFRRDQPNTRFASCMNNEVYTISRIIYETFPFDATDTTVKAAGERLYALGDIDTMRAVYYLLTSCHNGFLTLQKAFDGIGSWQA